ncbi:MAG: hypothetical protein JW837_18045 [Sedimentisphaerales bacterium]|nr:hypothetical protein [Sedimentisphaerales bacterium]
MLTRLSLAFVFFVLITVPIQACTIFVLTDTERALFCNNEDHSNPVTRIWFVRPGEGFYGCAYVGFDNGWAQGGLNTEGLAFDWVAGYKEKWEPSVGMKPVRGNPSERMLETCTSVKDTVNFYRKNWEPSFSYAKILVADKTGTSAVIGAKEGRLQVLYEHQSRGFGYGGRKLRNILNENTEPTVTKGFDILRTCIRNGCNATKYSNIFDLKKGEIFLFGRFSDWTKAVKLDLGMELQKPEHYYDIPRIKRQVTQAPIPLFNNMKRFLLDQYKPIPDNEPEITNQIRKMIQNALEGTMSSDDYTEELWREISPGQNEIRAEIKRLGKFISLTLVERKTDDKKCSYRYRLEFDNAAVLMHYILNKDNKVAFSQPEYIEYKSVLSYK